MAFASIALGATSDEIIARGRYLAELGGCQSCHTQPGAPAYAGGRFIDTPFGQVSSPNITADLASGIGQWSADDFYRAMHDGIGHDGEFLYPAMPFPWYTIVTRDDVLAIQAYLFSLPPVLKHRIPNRMTFPYSVRTSLTPWRERFFKPTVFAPDPQRAAQVNRGDYLVNGLAHCSLCHNGAPDAATAKPRTPFAGGVIDNWYALNLAPEVRGAVAAWSEADIVTFLKTGVAPAMGKAAAPVAESVHALGSVNDEDLQAIATYLKTTPPGSQVATSGTPFDGAQAQGGQGYLDRCAACHGLDGRGLPDVIPALAGNAVVGAADPRDALKAVLGGRVADGTYAPMAAVGAAMTDDEVADVVNFVRQHFGNAAAPTATPALVAELRKGLDTPMNPSSAAACTPVPPGPIASGVNQPLSGIPAGVWTVDSNNPWPRILALADRVERYIPMATSAQRVNVLTGIYCKALLRNRKVDPATRTALIGAFSQQMYSAIRDYPLIREHAAQ